MRVEPKFYCIKWVEVISANEGRKANDEERSY